MKWILSLLGVLLFLVGLVFTLQGINLLPGSFMTGQIEYAILGIVLIAAGIALVVFANRRRSEQR